MALVKSDGTVLAKSPGGTILAAYTQDPMVTVLVNVYENTPYDHVNYPTVKKQLKFRAGQVVKQSVWDAAFAVPTISAVTPNTGLVAGGTAFSVTGTNFAPGATLTIGGTTATSIVVVSQNTITGVSPAKTAGAYNVVVTTAGGTATATNAFTAV